MPTVMSDAVEHAGPALESPHPYSKLLEQSFDLEAEFRALVRRIHGCL